MEGGKVTGAGVRKPKKKQVKGELDRIKQAEKKKRRLEKALATSAAICSELEKKKQKKKEEQDRLDEEGAALAEAVALHVLLGEDSDDSSEVKDEGFTSWDHAGEGGGQSLPPYQDFSMYWHDNTGWASDDHRYGLMLNQWGNFNFMVTSDPLGRGFYPLGLSVDHLAAQAVSSLKIADDACVDAYMFKNALRG